MVFAFIMDYRISIVTYNHKEFIVTALESVFVQRTSYDHAIKIGEGCPSGYMHKGCGLWK